MYHRDTAALLTVYPVRCPSFGCPRPAVLLANVLLILLCVANAQPLAQDAPQTPAESPRPGNRGAREDAFLVEPPLIGRAIDLAIRTVGDGSRSKNGFYLEGSILPTGAGWPSGGPGYRRWASNDHVFVDASAAASWRAYKAAQATFEIRDAARSRLSVGTQAKWQDLTQVAYFGRGASTPESDGTEYRLQSTDVVLHATVRPARRLAIAGRSGWLGSLSILPPDGRSARGAADARALFPGDPAFARTRQPSFVYGEASVALDTRDFRSHPTSGALYRAAWTRYSDRSGGSFSFHRYEAEVAQFVPVRDGRIVTAFHGWFVATDAADGRQVPFYLLPSLGGHNTLRSYADYRFHDRAMLLVNVESRVALFSHVDLAAFVDAGNVASHASGVNLHKTSYGVGVRAHSRTSTFARLDAAHGAEGWRVVFRMNDPLHLARLSRRTAAAPFVP